MSRGRDGIGGELAVVALALSGLAATFLAVVVMQRRHAPPPAPPVAATVAPAPVGPDPGPAPPPAPAPAPRPAEPAPAPVDPTPGIVAKLAESAAEQTRLAAEADARLAQAETAGRAARAESQRWRRHEALARAQVEAYTTRADALEAEADEVQQERDLLAQERDSTKAALAKAREHARSSYAVVAHRGPDGTWRKPILIECRDGMATLQPDGLAFTLMELSTNSIASSPFGARVHPLAGAVLRRAMEIKSAGDGQGGAAVPYVFFVVRPDGIRPFYEARGQLESLGIAFGYELVDQDWVIDAPDAGGDESAAPAARPSPLRRTPFDRMASRGTGGESRGGAGADPSANPFVWPPRPPGPGGAGGGFEPGRGEPGRRGGSNPGDGTWQASPNPGSTAGLVPVRELGELSEVVPGEPTFVAKGEGVGAGDAGGPGTPGRPAGGAGPSSAGGTSPGSVTGLNSKEITEAALSSGARPDALHRGVGTFGPDSGSRRSGPSRYESRGPSRSTGDGGGLGDLASGGSGPGGAGPGGGLGGPSGGSSHPGSGTDGTGPAQGPGGSSTGGPKPGRGGRQGPVPGGEFGGLTRDGAGGSQAGSSGSVSSNPGGTEGGDVVSGPIGAGGQSGATGGQAGGSGLGSGSATGGQAGGSGPAVTGAGGSTPGGAGAAGAGGSEGSSGGNSQPGGKAGSLSAMAGGSGTPGAAGNGSPGGVNFGMPGGSDSPKSAEGGATSPSGADFLPGMGTAGRKDPRPRKVLELVVACGPNGVLIRPGGYQFTPAKLASADRPLRQALQAIVAARQKADPGAALRPRLNFLVEPGGHTTYSLARRQTILSDLDWPVTLRVAEGAVPVPLTRESFR